MSYILDALRRADSERERGTIPGIHAQPVPLLPDEEVPQPRVSAWVWGSAALGVIAVLAGALVWALARPEASPLRAASNLPSPTPALEAPAGALAGSAEAPAGRPANATPNSPGNAGAAPSPKAPQAPQKALPPPHGTTAPGSAALPSVAARPQAAPTPARKAASAAPATRAERVRAARAPASGPAAEPAAAARVYSQSELPEEIRRGVPSLVVNGSVFSKNAADRFLIINGVIVHETESVAPDVVLEQIKQRSAVLATKGYRFEITY